MYFTRPKMRRCGRKKCSVERGNKKIALREVLHIYIYICTRIWHIYYLYRFEWIVFWSHRSISRALHTVQLKWPETGSITMIIVIQFFFLLVFCIIEIRT